MYIVLNFVPQSTPHTTQSNGLGDKTRSYVVFNLKLDWIVLSMGTFFIDPSPHCVWVSCASKFSMSKAAADFELRKS